VFIFPENCFWWWKSRFLNVYRQAPFEVEVRDRKSSRFAVLRRGQTYACPPRFWRSMACLEGPATGYNISKTYVPPLGRADGTSEYVREKRVFYMATAQNRVRADGHISATERNFFKRSKVAYEGHLRAQRSAIISTSIFGGRPTLA